MSTIRFDMPHALVTLTITDTGGVEIEVWPKQGQSAFVVVPPEIARQIAEYINRLADEAEAGEAVTEGDQDSVAADDGAPEAAQSNVYDLMSRRLARDRGES
jgi:hypothetical protein